MSGYESDETESVYSFDLSNSPKKNNCYFKHVTLKLYSRREYTLHLNEKTCKKLQKHFYSRSGIFGGRRGVVNTIKLNYDMFEPIIEIISFPRLTNCSKWIDDKEILIRINKSNKNMTIRI